MNPFHTLITYLFTAHFDINQYSDQAAGWTTGTAGFDSRQEIEAFIFTTATRPTLASLRPIQYTSRGSFPGGYVRGLETEYSTPPGVRTKNARCYNTSSPQLFTEWCLITHRDNFTFPLYSIYVYMSQVACSFLPTKNFYAFLVIPKITHAPHISFLSDHPANIWREAQIIKLLLV
jgi:hypothetical protein